MPKKPMVVIAVLLGVVAVVFWQYHEQPQFCATCRIMEPYLESWQKSDYGAYAHAIEDVTCLEYHVPTVEQQVHELVVYMQGDYEIPLPELKYPKEDCYDCHEHGTFDQIVEMTAELEETVGANPHASHDRELECRPCHKMHAESEDHCRACHQWEWEVP